ncbi:MAG TPA: hypothetical protein VMW67_04500 [Desulfobacteria bacterium]|nr:hypothetical protein [Desulfobacteria bacterium]
MLKGIAEKLDGTSKIIFFPYFQSKVLVDIPKTRTTLAVLKSLMEYVEEYDVKRFLVILDLEHFTGEIRGEIEEKLESLDVTIAETEALNPPHDNALRVEGRSRSGRDFVMLITVMGDEICPKIECHITRLVEEKYGVWIDPNQAKEEFTKKVRRTTGARRYGKLAEDLTEEELTKFFPQLMHALKAAERLIEP